jgi:hypothetical protein
MWPQQGPAAFVLAGGRPAASPHEQPAALASLAKAMTAYSTLERYPSSGAHDALNAEVRELGMDQTMYADPSGIDPSTVSDRRRPVLRLPARDALPGLPADRLDGQRDAAGRRHADELRPLIAEGYAGRTGAASAAQGCLAVPIHVTAGGRRLAALGW